MSTASLPSPDIRPKRRAARWSGQGWLGLAMLLLVAGPCLALLPWAIQGYAEQDLGPPGEDPRRAPSFAEPMGSDALGRSMLWRLVVGGAISLGVGAASAVLAVCIGVTWGAIAGYAGGRVDDVMMRFVDVMYGLPYVLLVVLVNLALEAPIERVAQRFFEHDVAAGVADVVTLLIAIGGVSWLTLSRVIRGQVLSLRGQPFVEAARASGVHPARIFGAHLLPNLVGPIVVYATLAVPAAILQESFLSFLGIGVQAPLPSWGNLAAEGVESLTALAMPGATVRWWLPLWPCLLLGVTLLSLNFIGEALRDRFDPKSRS